MSADPLVHQATFAVGKYCCTLSMPTPRPGRAGALAAEWEPEVPRRLSESELANYRRGRDAFIAEVAAKVGVSAAVLEV